MGLGDGFVMPGSQRRIVVDCQSINAIRYKDARETKPSARVSMTLIETEPQPVPFSSWEPLGIVNDRIVRVLGWPLVIQDGLA